MDLLRKIYSLTNEVYFRYATTSYTFKTLRSSSHIKVISRSSGQSHSHGSNKSTSVCGKPLQSEADHDSRWIVGGFPSTERQYMNCLHNFCSFDISGLLKLVDRRGARVPTAFVIIRRRTVVRCSFLVLEPPLIIGLHALFVMS